MRFKSELVLALAFSLAFMGASRADALFPYYPQVKLKVGQSIILKGVRNGDCHPTRVPGWTRISLGLPRTKLGQFSDGGPGKVDSERCNKVVGARGVKFTAKRKGSETLKIYKDKVRITVQ